MNTDVHKKTELVSSSFSGEHTLSIIKEVFHTDYLPVIKG